MIDVFYKVNVVLVLFVSACSKSEKLEEELDSIGEIIGDGMPLNDSGKPYVVDIEFDILTKSIKKSPIFYKWSDELIAEFKKSEKKFVFLLT